MLVAGVLLDESPLLLVSDFDADFDADSDLVSALASDAVSVLVLDELGESDDDSLARLSLR